MIRNFVYLDSGKLRSLSSQIFEGVTERVLTTNRTELQKSEEQKGPLSSGRVIGDIFSQEDGSSQLKFLEDHAYTLFENELLGRNALNLFAKDAGRDAEPNMFVKVTGKLKLNDLAASGATIKDFNDIGLAFWRVSNTPNNGIGPVKQVNDTEAKRRAAESGLQLDPKMTEAASKLINFGFGGMLEATIETQRLQFSAPLKREFLRDNEQLMLHKYSRSSQHDFSLIGLVTQRAGLQTEDDLPDVANADGVKQSMRNLAMHMGVVEQFFVEPSENEYVVDPIAIYSTIDLPMPVGDL